MESEADDVLRSVGPRLRALRQRGGATLAELSERTGISASTPSRLESGQRKPTLELLLPLARAHQVPLDDLVDAPVTGDPRVYPRPLTRGEHTFLPLTRRPGGIQAYKQIIRANFEGSCELKTHEGYEWMYILNGRVRLRLGEHDVVLTVGEVAEFDTRIPHAVSNPFAEPAELLNLYGPQGERLHVRARPATHDTA